MAFNNYFDLVEKLKKGDEARENIKNSEFWLEQTPEGRAEIQEKFDQGRQRTLEQKKSWWNFFLRVLWDKSNIPEHRKPTYAAFKIQRAWRAHQKYWRQIVKEKEEEEEPNVHYSIQNVFENYYADERKHFFESFEEEVDKESFKKKFEDHMIRYLLDMRFGEENIEREFEELWKDSGMESILEEVFFLCIYVL